ncbi:MAG: hypothetical protein EAY65_03540 [Alphaproteobacteria bacterium]|nr:MAG: hypothetical protein EAY65_03540 [Alphaproteobacteria bacterium]
MCAYAHHAVAEKPIPRIMYALYDKEVETKPRLSSAHRTLEMPLNWLGYHLQFFEHGDALPAWGDDALGMVWWLHPGVEVRDPEKLVAWIEEGIKRKKKIIIMGNMGLPSAWYSEPEKKKRVEALLNYIGVDYGDVWVSITYNSQFIKKDRAMVEMEGRTYEGIVPAYVHTQAVAGATSHVRLRNTLEDGRTLESDVVVTSSNGGYIAQGFALYTHQANTEEKEFTQRWLVDPFRFLSTTLGAKDKPRPDVTTLWGKRIFYTHLDGDGWNNLTELDEYKDQRVISAKVLMEKVYKAFPSFAFTVGPIVSELQESCYGSANSVAVAREIFALPNVEASSHTMTHPLFWEYFDDGDNVKEVRYLDQYPPKPTDNESIYDALSHSLERDESAKQWEKIRAQYDADAPLSPMDAYMRRFYKTPRSYACAPYNEDAEITGAAAYIQNLLPKGKKVKLVQWSGNTSPSEQILRKTREAGLLNINGGDSRFDKEYLSYAYVAPIGIAVGNERQIYSSNSNENTYTESWSDKFFGFRYLVDTLRNTEEPRRVSPVNIYYHTYSAQKQGSMEALLQNYRFAEAQQTIPIFTSHYARIALGYYETQLIDLGEQRWRVRNRGALQTIRFDDATLKQVDFARSVGVIGQNHYQSSLYVALNPTVSEPIIALKRKDDLIFPAPASIPYLMDSRWDILDFKHSKNSVTMRLKGFGRGVVHLVWPRQKAGGKQKLRVRTQIGANPPTERDVYVSPIGLVTTTLQDNSYSDVTVEWFVP